MKTFGCSYSSVCSAREEWVGSERLACIAENTLSDVVAVAVEVESDLVTDCRCDAVGCEGEAV
jgi:hypothetical protein